MKDEKKGGKRPEKWDDRSGSRIGRRDGVGNGKHPSFLEKSGSCKYVGIKEVGIRIPKDRKSL